MNEDQVPIFDILGVEVNDVRFLQKEVCRLPPSPIFPEILRCLKFYGEIANYRTILIKDFVCLDELKSTIKHDN